MEGGGEMTGCRNDAPGGGGGGSARLKSSRKGAGLYHVGMYGGVRYRGEDPGLGTHAVYGRPEVLLGPAHRPAPGLEPSRRPRPKDALPARMLPDFAPDARSARYST